MSNEEQLKQLIIDNPELPLVIFATDDANNGDCSTMSTEILSARITEVTLYETKYESAYVYKEDFWDILYEDMSVAGKDEGLSEEEFSELVKEEYEKAEFTKCICVVVGR